LLHFYCIFTAFLVGMSYLGSELGDVRVRDKHLSIHRVFPVIPLANIEFMIGSRCVDVEPTGWSLNASWVWTETSFWGSELGDVRVRDDYFSIHWVLAFYSFS